MTQRNTSRRPKGFFERLREEILPGIERSSVPLYGAHDDNLIHDRTGVLYRIGDHYFILTAAHKLREYVKHNIPLCVDCCDYKSIPIPLGDSVFHTTVGDDRDVAAIRLPRNVVEDLQAHKEFLTHADIRLKDHSDQSFYVLFGYPRDWSGPTSHTSVLSMPLIYACRRYVGEIKATTIYDSNMHILLEFDRTAINVSESTEHQLPTPHGVSGCGIWKVADWTAEGYQKGRLSHPCLVALEHHWSRENKYVVGTWIGCVLALIQETYPDVAKAMELIYPRN